MPSEDKILQYGKFIMLGVGTFILYKALQGIGLIKSADTTLIEDSEKKNGWSSTFYKESIKAKKVTSVDFLQPANVIYLDLAKLINTSFGLFNDKEDKIFGAIKQIKTQSSLSFLVANYFALFKIDLYNELKSRLSESEMITILNHTNTLPNYKVK